MNIEHRTSNIEHRIWSALRFIDFKLCGIHTTCGEPIGLGLKAEGQVESNF